VKKPAAARQPMVAVYYEIHYQHRDRRFSEDGNVAATLVKTPTWPCTTPVERRNGYCFYAGK
jgi:hypothetical protein